MAQTEECDQDDEDPFVQFDNEDEVPIIIDNGSGFIKAGFCPEKAPRAVFPAVVGRDNGSIIRGPEHYVGDKAIEYRGLAVFKHPIENGIVTCWDYMERLWHHTFYNELRVAPEEHPVLMTEAPWNPSANREKMTQIVFETFNVPQYYVSIAAVLSLFASCRHTGIVLDSGDDVTFAVPIYEGYALPHAVVRCRVGGRNLNEYLRKLLQKRGLNYPTVHRTGKEEIRKIKEKLCYVAMDYDEELKKANCFQNEYELPDGSVIHVSEESFKTTECLFNFDMLSECVRYSPNEKSIHQMVYDSVMKCDDEIRPTLLNNIVISGGNTMFDGMKAKLMKELKGGKETLIDGYLRLNSNLFVCRDIIDLVYKYSLFPYKMIDTDTEIDFGRVYMRFLNECTETSSDLYDKMCLDAKKNKKLHDSNDIQEEQQNMNREVNTHNRQFLPFRGGSMLASLSSFEQMWITKDEYDEAGPSIVHRKCT
eukprot:781253_1